MFSQQELSNVIWAHGAMKVCNNEELMRRASVEMLNRGLDKFVPQAISNVCWAYAKHDLIYEQFLEASACSVPHDIGMLHCTVCRSMICLHGKSLMHLS